MKTLDKFLHSKFVKAVFFLACIGRICTGFWLLVAASAAVKRGDEDWWTNQPTAWGDIA